VFLSVVETRSFSETARRLGVSTSAVSAAVVRLERKLTVRLLNRTTRRVIPTFEGAEFYQRCKHIIADLEQAESSVIRSAGTPGGRLRVGMPAALGKMWVIPRLSRFLEAYPAISIEVVLEDFIAGSHRDGLDAIIQVGELPSSRLTLRKLSSVDYVVCASPKYLGSHGIPEMPGDLIGHNCLTYRRPRNGQIRQWRFTDGSSMESISMNGNMTFNSGEALVAAAASGLGIVQVAQYYARPWLESGELVEVLSDYRVWAYDISVVFQQRKRMASRLRVFIDFLAEIFALPPWASRERQF
jgi:LysR family transcriptional regulator for bpeEF and oprC